VRSTKLVTISLPPELYEKAIELAKEEDRTCSGIFRKALQHYLAQKRQEKTGTSEPSSVPGPPNPLKASSTHL
jgi:predicted transcriptional regulator